MAVFIERSDPAGTMRNATWKWCQRPLAGCARQGGRPKHIRLRLYFRFCLYFCLTWVEIDAKVGQRILQSVRIVSGSIGQFDINH
jgi:hypothetical protein